MRNKTSSPMLGASAHRAEKTKNSAPLTTRTGLRPKRSLSVPLISCPSAMASRNGNNTRFVTLLEAPNSADMEGSAGMTAS